MNNENSEKCEDNNNTTQVLRKRKSQKSIKFAVPDVLCNCLQKCTEKVQPPLIKRICMYSYALRSDKELHKEYLASLILGREKKFQNFEIVEGKRLRKMTYRYFVPVLSDLDVEDMVKARKNSSLQREINETVLHYDHIEVCLKAFTNVHLISEKKIIMTRTMLQLRNSLKCNQPFACHSALKSFNGNVTMNPENENTKSKQYNMSTEIAMWFIENKNPLHNIDPRPYLPEGLILPDSIDCMPIFGDNVPTNHELTYRFIKDNGLDIVENFFHNQLWKLEYFANDDT